MNHENDFISEFNEYLKCKETDTIEGYYNIDVSKENSHAFKRFIVALKKTHEAIVLYFIDAQCYGARKYWKSGDVYALTEVSDFNSDTIDIFLNEVRGDGNKVPTEYDFKVGENTFQLITKGGKRKYIDHFIKIDPNQISRDFPFSKIQFRIPNHEENQSLDSEYQSGLELMFWLSKLEAKKLDTDLILQSLNVAFDSLTNTKNYPIAEYNGVWHATFGLSVVFANIIKNEFGWEWIYVEKSSDIDVGWTLVSKDRKLGIRAEQIFYERIMRRKTVDFIDFYKNVKESISTNKVNDGRILMIELPCE